MNIRLIGLATVAFVASVSVGSAQEPSQQSDRASSVIRQADLYTIKILRVVDYPFGRENKGTATGSGFLVNKEKGWFVTNAHVVGKSPSNLWAHFKDQGYRKAKKVFVDNHADLAVISMDPKGIPAGAKAAELDCRLDVPAGAAVIAYGHPWSLDFTATRGIISGTKTLRGEEKLQTDSAINPGNSGGPLIDQGSGKIVGVNASMIRGRDAVGLNFAIPSHIACNILALLEKGIDPAPPVLPAAFATTSRSGELVVASVKGVWEASLRPGDRVLAVNGDLKARYLSRLLNHLRGSEEASLEIQRGTQKINVTLPVPQQKDHVVRKGITVSGMLLGYGTSTESSKAKVWVQYVNPASIAQRARIPLGSEVLALNGIAASNLEDLLAILKENDRKRIEIITRRPRFNLLSGDYTYTARKFRVVGPRLVDEKGLQ